MIRPVLIAAVLALAAVAPAQGSPGRDCGLTPRIHGVRFQVVIEAGHVRCRTAKRVATKFARTDRMRPARSWVCFRGHGSEPAASCSGPHGAVVRVYAPG